MNTSHTRSLVLRRERLPLTPTMRRRFQSFLSISVAGLLPHFCLAQNPITQVGDQLEMPCGEHRIVLTCGHSEEIAQRQKYYPRMCNDNKLEFIAKDGSKKTFTTYIQGQHRDKTPIKVVCEEFLPINVFEIVAWTHDTVSNFAVAFNEEGSRVNTDSGKDAKPGTYPKYRIDYQESKTVGRIQIREKK